MDDGFGLLEQKVRKAAELVKRLQVENKALQDDLRRAQVRVKESEKALEGADASAQDARRLESLAREVKGLRAEREELRGRIAKLVDVLDRLE